jgi:hypothetical protein
MKTRMNLTATVALGAVLTGSAGAAEILVSSDITTSTTWTKNNVYRLTKQIYVTNGASLTIEAGTVIASTTGVGGSLAITRGARLFAQGTAAEPIIMTSTSDVATWTNGNPKTGTWRAVANEWGNLTICGRAYIGKYGQGAVGTNTAAPNAANYANMEGLVDDGTGRTYYGGGDDMDDSGTLSHLSLRYGGKVVGLGNELNGLSLGGIGKSTEIDHIEIMNNVDDGIEMWGGTVDLKYFSIWNIGDDSLDLDHGWRGKAQFGLIVSGYSIPGAASGSGFPDSMFEIDGAAKSDAQPVTTCSLWNMTAIGQPFATGRHAVKFRDNARAQFNASVFMDCPAQVIRNDNTDGESSDGQTGYGHNGTLNFADTWTTDYNVYSSVNPFPSNPASRYTAMSSGKLIQFTDSVFFNNNNASAYTEADSRGVFGASNNNVKQAAVRPIKAITRGPNAVSGSLLVNNVISLDPRAAGDAVTAATSAPNDGFFTPVTYRGAFSPTSNWMLGWTAADAFGYIVRPLEADLSGDGTVDGVDLGILLGNWGGSGVADLSGDGTVDGVDLGILLGNWGATA